MSTEWPDTSAGVDLGMWNEGALTSSPLLPYTHSSHTPFFGSSLLHTVPQLCSFQHTLQSCSTPQPSFVHLKHMSCKQAAVPQLSLLMQLDPDPASPAGRSPHPTQGHSCHGACVPLLFCPLVYAQEVAASLFL